MRRLSATIFLAIAASAAAAPKLMFPIPTGAVTPDHVVISPGASEQDHFWLNEEYPGTSAVEHYRKVFAGWRPCPGRHVGWETFGDRASGDDRFIHRQLHHWVNKANDTAVALVVQYSSKGSTYRISPDSNKQFVALIRITQKDASKTLAEMGAICAKDS